MFETDGQDALVLRGNRPGQVSGIDASGGVAPTMPLQDMMVGRDPSPFRGFRGRRGGGIFSGGIDGIGGVTSPTRSGGAGIGGQASVNPAAGIPFTTAPMADNPWHSGAPMPYVSPPHIPDPWEVQDLPPSPTRGFPDSGAVEPLRGVPLGYSPKHLPFPPILTPDKGTPWPQQGNPTRPRLPGRF